VNAITAKDRNVGKADWVILAACGMLLLLGILGGFSSLSKTAAYLWWGGYGAAMALAVGGFVWGACKSMPHAEKTEPRGSKPPSRP